MLKFNSNVPERKTLAKRLEELTGIHSIYTRAPLYAYEVGDYTIDRDGNVLVDEMVADQDVLGTLMTEGLISGGEIVGGDNAEPEETVEATELGETVETTQPDTNEATAGDPSDAVMEEQETVEREEQEVAGQDEPETAEPEMLETDEVPLDMDFSLPLGNHNGVSLRNLVHLIYSRASLINKATGAHFHVSGELIEALKDDSCTYTVQNFRKALAEYEAAHGDPGIEGFRLEEDKVIFCAFPTAEDVDHLTANGQLVVLMNNQAITQKRIQAKTVDETNEKYALRIWLIRLGMNGDEFKSTRKILMENLGGHTAFRTPADAEKARIKNQKKRDALKAAKEEAAAEPIQTGEAEAGARNAEVTVDTAETAEVEAAL